MAFPLENSTTVLLHSHNAIKSIANHESTRKRLSISIETYLYFLIVIIIIAVKLLLVLWVHVSMLMCTIDSVYGFKYLFW